jgi:hypothetical protein
MSACAALSPGIADSQFKPAFRLPFSAGLFSNPLQRGYSAPVATAGTTSRSSSPLILPSIEPVTPARLAKSRQPFYYLRITLWAHRGYRPMKHNITEENLKQQAKQYLKRHYGEDTVSMDVLNNNVQGGDGELHVDCTVSIEGSKSNWTKWFKFEDGKVTDLRAKMR